MEYAEKKSEPSFTCNLKFKLAEKSTVYFVFPYDIFSIFLQN